MNSVLPALIAGNAVLLKPSPQTPLTAERLALAFTRAGLPEGLLQVLHLSPSLTTFAVQHPSVGFVSFTGSVVGGQAIEKAAVEAPGFKGVGLEVCVEMIVMISCFMLNSTTAWRERSSLCPRRCQTRLHYC